ncbi:MAG: porin family protein [Sphingomonadales bacterium]|nr:porin family protein [Sphingomonadales bacterium]
MAIVISSWQFVLRFALGINMRGSAFICALALGAFAVSTSVAQAGGSIKDDASAVKYAFQGLYVGVQGSYNMSDVDGDWDTSGDSDSFWSTFDLDGLGAGGQIGFNQRLGTFLVGIEADYQGLDISDSKTDNETIGAGKKTRPKPSTDTLSFSSMATVRGRFGYVHNNSLLIFGTIGIGQIKGSADLEEGAERVPTKDFNDKRGDLPQYVRIDETGLVYGGGIEWAFAKNLSLKAEYMRFDVDAWYNLSGLIDGDKGDNLSVKAIDSVRIGLNFHLN